MINEIVSLWIWDADRYVFAAGGFIFGPSIVLALGSMRILDPSGSSEEYTIFLFKRTWPYILMLLITAVSDFGIVMYRNSRLIEPEEKKVFNMKKKLQEPEDPISNEVEETIVIFL